MSLTVTQRPSITYLAETSRWNAVKNPVIYRLTRKDNLVDSVANDGGGNAELTFAGVDLTAFYEVGDIVMFESDVPGYGVAAEVLSSTFSGGDTLVVLDTQYNHPVGGYANNLTKRPNYKVEIEVYNQITGAILHEAPFYKSTNPLGVATVDVSAILRANLSHDIDADLTGSTEVFEDTNAFKKFYIKYRETWTGSAEGQTSDNANQFFTALAAMQIPAAQGGNMAVYNIPPAKFLTKLDTLVMWRGYPFLISAIINDEISGDVYLNANPDASTPDDYAGEVVHFDLNQILSDQSVDDVAVQIFEEGSPDAAVSEEKTVELRDACDNPVMLMGRNSLGGILQWLFDENQEYLFDHGDGIKKKRLRLFADDLTINQWEALQEFITLGEVYKNAIIELTSDTIKTSSRIGQQVYVVSEDGTKVGVIVDDTRNSTETNQVKHKMELEIEFPEIFT